MPAAARAARYLSISAVQGDLFCLVSFTNIYECYDRIFYLQLRDVCQNLTLFYVIKYQLVFKFRNSVLKGS